LSWGTLGGTSARKKWGGERPKRAEGLGEDKNLRDSGGNKKRERSVTQETKYKERTFQETGKPPGSRRHDYGEGND